MSGKPTLRNNQDGTCNCRPLSNGCFFQELDGSRCRCKCHTKPTFETTPVTFESDKPISSHTNQLIEEKVCKSKLATRPILYTDTIRGKQVLRDDMWAVTTKELKAISQTEQECDKKWELKIKNYIKNRRNHTSNICETLLVGCTHCAVAEALDDLLNNK